MSGQFKKVRFTTEKKPSAKFKGKQLSKITEGVFRTGIQFRNLGAVKEAIEAGERGEVQPLPWGKWVEYPNKIEHKGVTYIRLYPPHARDENGKLVPTWKNSQIKVKYLVDGQEVSKEDFESFLNPSDRSKGETPDCFTIREENVEILS